MLSSNCSRDDLQNSPKNGFENAFRRLWRARGDGLAGRVQVTVRQKNHDLRVRSVCFYTGKRSLAGWADTHLAPSLRSNRHLVLACNAPNDQKDQTL